MISQEAQEFFFRKWKLFLHHAQMLMTVMRERGGAEKTVIAGELGGSTGLDCLLVQCGQISV
jgi:hypothetical protein